MIKKDFLGNEITPGCWLAFPGTGNKSDEHGLLLFWVDRIAGERIYVHRLEAKMKYSLAGEQGVQVQVVSKYITNAQKCVVINPPEEMKRLFALTTAGLLPPDMNEKIEQWLLGHEAVCWA